MGRKVARQLDSACTTQNSLPSTSAIVVHSKFSFVTSHRRVAPSAIRCATSTSRAGAYQSMCTRFFVVLGSGTLHEGERGVAGEPVVPVGFELLEPALQRGLPEPSDPLQVVGIEDDGGQVPVRGRVRLDHAELVPFGVGEGGPLHVLFSDLLFHVPKTCRAKPEQTLHLGLTMGRAPIQMHPVLRGLALRHLHEVDPGVPRQRGPFAGLALGELAFQRGRPEPADELRLIRIEHHREEGEGHAPNVFAPGTSGQLN